jgi:hypothetical protein
VTDYYRDCWIYDGQVRTVERTTETGMHVRGWGDDMLAWRGHQDDLAYLNGVVVSDTPVKGNWPCAFTPHNMLLVQHQPGNGILSLYAAGGAILGTVDAPYASEGIHHVAASGGENYTITPIMGNDPSLMRVMPNGETWFNCVETENFIVGQFGRDPDFGGSLSKLDKRTGTVTRWLGYTPHPPRAVEMDGVLTVAISGRDTPAPDQVEWAAGFPPLPGQPPIVTPPPAPADCTAERARIVALRSELDTARIDLSACESENRNLHTMLSAEFAARAGLLTPDQVLKLVNDATGQMAGYWRYLGVQGAVDRAVKAELAKRT